MRKHTLAALFFLCILLCVPAHAREDDFFSPERFALKTEIIRKMSGDGDTQKSIRKFSEVFSKAVNEFSGGDTASAERDLHLARDMWPEFFGPDFVLALAYEKSGREDAAARYYKSYLIKLKAFEDGRYGISEPLIRSVLSREVESYDSAFELVRARLAEKGISIAGVRPMMTIPAFLLPLALLALMVLFYAAVCAWLWPFCKRMYKISHPPEGFWVCRNCFTENPDPNKVCQECGRPHGKK